MGAPLGTQRWADLMGRDLEPASPQPLQPVRVNRNGVVKVHSPALRAAGFAPGERVSLAVGDRGCTLENRPDGVVLASGKPVRLPASQAVAAALGPAGAAGAILVVEEARARLLPVRVVEHADDVLGPRFLDDVRDGEIVRHVVPAPPRAGWTAGRLDELEALLCSQPFRIDPLSPLAEGDDWVAWMTRNRLLRRPGPDDDALRRRFVAGLHAGRQSDGSWGAVPSTAYAVLRLLALGEKATGQRIRRAAAWLLSRREPPPRPGTWMLTDACLDEWLARRTASEPRPLAPCEILRVPPDERVSFYSWRFPDAEQDPFRAQEAQRVIPTCARHHPPACEPRITHVSAVAAEALLRCGHADHPRLRRYIHTAFHLGGEWGYWCGCGALGLFDADIPADDGEPDFDVRAGSADGRADLSPLRWAADAGQCVRLSHRPELPEVGTHLEPFTWRRLPGDGGCYALIGTGWQNGDCWAKTNRALAAHPACAGSLTEHLAVFQASRYQTSLGEWDQAYPAGMLSLLSLYDSPAAKALVARTVPWLREHQGDDGLWHHEELPRKDWGRPALPPEPRLATYHVAAALAKFGVLERLRP